MKGSHSSLLQLTRHNSKKSATDTSSEQAARQLCATTRSPSKASIYQPFCLAVQAMNGSATYTLLALTALRMFANFAYRGRTKNQFVRCCAARKSARVLRRRFVDSMMTVCSFDMALCHFGFLLPFLKNPSEGAPSLPQLGVPRKRVKRCSSSLRLRIKSQCMKFILGKCKGWRIKPCCLL